LQELVEWFARRYLDDPRERINSPTIFPDFARLVGKREGRKPGDKIGKRAVTLKYGLRVIERVWIASLTGPGSAKSISG
jgi:hypothetical protein